MSDVGWLDRHFGVGLPILRFARNVVLASLGAVSVLLCAYLLLRPGAWQMIAQGGGAALGLLARQVAANGVPVVAAATWIGAMALGTWARGRGPWTIALADGSMRLLVVAAMHAAAFVASAGAFGSFGGDRLTALRVVAPTLARAAAFENLSGVYLYAVLLIAMPMQVAAMRRVRNAPPRRAAWLVATLSTGILVISFTWAMTALSAR